MKTLASREGLSKELNPISTDMLNDNRSNGHHIVTLEDMVFTRLQQIVDGEPFYEVVEAILERVEDPEVIALCAELARRREPGGTYYQARLWAKIKALVEGTTSTNGSMPALAKVCRKIGVRYSDARNYVIQGEVIREAEQVVDATALRSLPAKIITNAQQYKNDASAYLIEAVAVLKARPNASIIAIHNNWCRKHGSRSQNLDIIKPGDWWAFGHPKWLRDDRFPGSIPGEIYANALYYFAPQHGVAVDPMAGSGMLKRVYDDRERWQKDSEFNLDIHLFDLNPHLLSIQQHDARKPLPIMADWIFIDPPYFGQSDHLYESELAAAKDYQSYLSLMHEVIIALVASLNPHGRLCVLLPKWSGQRSQDPNYDIPADVAAIAIRAGVQWIDAAFVSRGRQQEGGGATKNNVAKRQRRMRSDTCILNVFEKREG